MKGTIYGIFEVAENEKGEMELIDNFVNRHFMWLFEMLIEIDGFICEVILGVEHHFVIKIKKEENE